MHTRSSVDQVLGLGHSVRGCLSDLDGVLTQTAKVHAAVWKEMFDDHLRRHAEQTNTAIVEFEPVGDYDAYVDGKPRADGGTRSFPESLGIELREGAPDDPPDADTVRDYVRVKAAPDTFLAGARALGVEPSQAAVFEDALAGVEAGQAGRFGLVVGVDRIGQADALRDHGADVVVNDLSELLEHR
jgi:beta-phosphoglucomutase-like phosphatase (HAD superfamily)